MSAVTTILSYFISIFRMFAQKPTDSRQSLIDEINKKYEQKINELPAIERREMTNAEVIKQLNDMGHRN